GAAEQQQFFGQRRFSGVGMRDDRERTPPRDFGRLRRRLTRHGLLHHVQRSGLDQFHLRRLEPDLMEFGGLAEDFSDVQLDKTIVHFYYSERLADAAPEQRRQLLVIGR